MSDGSVLLEATSLSKVYRLKSGLLGVGAGEVVAVDDVSFTLERGESLGIVGESGSGKTTIARMLVGLEPLSAGTISVDGRPLGSKLRTARARRRVAKDIQIVFQNPYQSLDPRQKILSSVEEPLALHTALDRRARKLRARELLEEVGLDERVAGARPQALSGGQRQRVAIARALAVQPRILILDEAVASLDVSVQAQVLNLISATREREELSLIVITHDLAVANQICDNLVVLRSGKVVERGTRQQILGAPRDPYTRLLRSAVPTRGWKPVRRQEALAILGSADEPANGA
ncbi:MAG TPA: ATP-binding cassette domain-containing protein [Solirubrobacterales bacterium]|jgi:ABC-type glutathione transport system ATPase component|nr:ATP-binding cassette domain-containing protein [Solirubrobacterales bacterium]